MADTKLMTSDRSRSRGPACRAQAGFTLVEMMITMLLLTIVLTALLALLDRSSTHAQRDSQRGIAIRDVQNSVHRMAVELRQAYRVNGCGRQDVTQCTMADYARTIDINVRARDHSRRRVIYDCTAAYTGRTNVTSSESAAVFRSCTRRVSTSLSGAGLCCTYAGLGTAEPIIGRVLNWCVGAVGGCATAGSTPGLPFYSRNSARVFTYRTSQPSGTTTTLAQPNGNVDPTQPVTVGGVQVRQDPRLATEIGITIEVPAAGERRVGHRHNILLRDGAYLRNADGPYLGTGNP